MNIPERALITGASSGIGAEFARVLAAKGVNLVLAARRTEQLSTLAQELKTKYKIEAEVVTVDLTKENAHEVLLEASTKDGKIVDMLMSPQGVAQIGIKGALKGKSVIIPGVMNRLIFWTRLLLPNFLNILSADKSMQAGAGQIN